MYNSCMSQDRLLCIPCVDAHSQPKHPITSDLAVSNGLSWSSSTWAHTSLAGHTEIQLEPGIFVAVLSPEEHSYDGCSLSCPVYFLMYSAWAVKWVQSLAPWFNQVILIPAPLLGKDSGVQPSLFHFPSLSSHGSSSSLALPCDLPCLAQTSGPQQPLAAARGLTGGAVPDASDCSQVPAPTLGYNSPFCFLFDQGCWSLFSR